MANPQIFGVASSARSLNVTAQRRVNVYYDFPKEGAADRAAISIHARPGLTPFGYYGARPCRGRLVVPPYLYAVFGDRLFRIAQDGTHTVIAGVMLNGAGPVSMADNGTQLAIADDPNLYVLQLFGASAGTGQVPADGLVRVTAAGFLGARYVGYADNRFLVAVPGANPLTGQQWQTSNQGDGTGWNALAFSLADNAPDRLLAVRGYQGRVCLFGTQTTEFWSNVGTTPFAFNRMPGATAQHGLAAVDSIAELDDLGLGVLSRSADGQAVPALLTRDGYLEIGDADVVAAINGYATAEDAIGASYQVAKHRFYQLNFPTAGRCHVWDAQTRVWSEHSSYNAAHPHGIGPYLGGLAAQLGNRLLVFSTADGTVWQADVNRYEDDGVPLVRQLTSGHLFSNDDELILNAIQFNFEAGVGTPSGQGQSPVALLETSRDFGHTWSEPLSAPLGAGGRYETRVIFRRLGMAENLTVRLTVSDPIKFVLTGEAVDLERAA